MGTVAPATITRSRTKTLYLKDNVDDTSVTEFHCTGFKRFFNVPVNPTELVMENLPSYLSDNPLKPGSILASTCAMEVSAEFTRFALERMYRSLDAPTHNAIIDLPRRERRIVFIHMGVNSCATKFQLEVQGRNEATFSCPDERGWTPIKQPIDRNNSDLSTVYRTTLCLEPLVDLLTQRGFGVELSINAGRFVCNWVYFNSLQLAEQADAYSLFVHVPPASVVPVDRQVQFMAALLDCVARIH